MLMSNQRQNRNGARGDPSQPRRHQADPLARVPAIQRKVLFHSAFTQRTFERTWDRLKGDIYVLCVRTRTLDLETAAQTAENLIEKEFSKLKNDLKEEQDRYTHLMNGAGITSMPTYPSMDVEAEITSPQAMDWLALLELMDLVLMRLDSLWLQKEVETKARTARSYEWQRRFIKVSNRIRVLSDAARRSLQEELRKRESKRSGKGATESSLEPSSDGADSTGKPAEDLDSLFAAEELARAGEEGHSTGTEGGGRPIRRGKANGVAPANV
jgi:hypothetical protein